MPPAPAITSKGFGPPVFATAAEERLHRKRMLAAAFRLFSRFGFDEGVAGHITARDPEKLDHFWVNPFGMHFGQIRTSDLILVNHQGEVVEGKYPVNGAAFAIHSRVHSARHDVIAAAHAHSYSIPSRRMLARFTKTTQFSPILPASSTKHRKASASPKPSASAKPPFSKITACSQSATASKRPPGGSSRWIAAVRLNCWRKGSAPRKRSITPPPLPPGNKSEAT